MNYSSNKSEYRNQLNDRQLDANNVYLSGAKNMAEAIRYSQNNQMN